MRQTGRTGGRTGAQADGGSERKSGRAGKLANGRTGAGTLGGQADGGGRAGGRQISEGKTPDLTRQLTWPWEIQRGRPRVTVKLPHLPPPSR